MNIVGTITEGSRCLLVDAQERTVAEQLLYMPPFIIPTAGLSGGTYTLEASHRRGSYRWRGLWKWSDEAGSRRLWGSVVTLDVARYKQGG